MARRLTTFEKERDERESSKNHKTKNEERRERLQKANLRKMNERTHTFIHESKKKSEQVSPSTPTPSQEKNEIKTGWIHSNQPQLKRRERKHEQRNHTTPFSVKCRQRRGDPDKAWKNENKHEKSKITVTQTEDSKKQRARSALALAIDREPG